MRPIFVFTNFTEGNVLSTFPIPAGPNKTNGGYSPLWQVNLVAWNNLANATVLTSSTAVTAAETAEEITVTSTPIIVVPVHPPDSCQGRQSTSLPRRLVRAAA